VKNAWLRLYKKSLVGREETKVALMQLRYPEDQVEMILWGLDLEVAESAWDRRLKQLEKGVKRGYISQEDATRELLLHGYLVLQAQELMLEWTYERKAAEPEIPVEVLFDFRLNGACETNAKLIQIMKRRGYEDWEIFGYSMKYGVAMTLDEIKKVA